MKKFKLLIFLIILAQVVLLVGEWHPPKQVREIPIANLPDLAIASIDALGPVIYYNPTLIMQAGRGVAAFTRAHEYGHIYNNHIQRSMFVTNPYARINLSKQNEVEADLFAVGQLYDNDPQAISEIIIFFRRQGPIPLSHVHPPGTERAAYIEAKFNELKTNIEPDIESEPLDPVSFSIEIPSIRIGELGGVISIYIDDKLIGKISNFGDDYDNSIDIDDIEPGIHQYHLNVKIYSFYGYQPIYQRTISGRGQINIEEYDTFMVSDGAFSPKLVKYGY